MTNPISQHATPDQASVLLGHQLTLMQQDPALAELLPPVMLWGPPGVGKSSLVRDLAAREGIGFIDIRLSQREPVDLRGLPVPDRERGVVDWLLAGEWPRDPDSRGILLFDELTAADRSLQVAAYELILDRRLGDLYRLPPGWLWAGLPSNDLQAPAVQRRLGLVFAISAQLGCSICLVLGFFPSRTFRLAGPCD